MSTEKKSGGRTFQPAIDVIICGLVAVFVDSRRSRCRVGILRKTPPQHPHKLDIDTTERDELGGPIKSHKGSTSAPHVLKLSSPQGISLRKENMSIKRRERPSETDPEYDSFEWAVALEGPDFYNKPIGAKESGFYPFLTFDSGELYTHKISESELQRTYPPDTNFRHFGFVAVEIGIHIPLPPGVQATFTNGFLPVFTSKSNRRYEIRVDRGPEHQPTGTLVTDAEAYYVDKAIGGKLKEEEKIHFQSQSDPLKAGPEAACFVAYIDQSNPI